MTDEEKREVQPFGRLTLQELKSLWSSEEPGLSVLAERPLSRVYVPRNPVEAGFLMDMLQQEGIPAIYHSNGDTAFGGIFTMAQGAGVIITADEDAQKALELIESLIAEMDRDEVQVDSTEVTGQE